MVTSLVTIFFYLFQIWTDFLYVPGIIASAKLHARTSSEPVYLYRISIDAGLNWKKQIIPIKEPG